METGKEENRDKNLSDIVAWVMQNIQQLVSS